MKTYSLLNVDKNKTILLTEAGLIIGRDTKELDCFDKRISRQHGSIELKDEKILIKSTHTNPIFFNSNQFGSENMKTISNGQEVYLSSNDTFQLLPSQFAYKIKIIDNQKDAPDVIANVSQLSTARLEDDLKTISNDLKDAELVIPQQAPQQRSHKRPADSVDDESISKKAKSNENSPVEQPPINQSINHEETEFGPATSLADTLPMTSSLSNELQFEEPTPVIKQEPNESTSQADNNAPSSFDCSTGSVPIKQEVPECSNNDNAANSLNPVSDVGLRPSCPYGIRCYRGTPDHRDEMAHPGDMDYRRPTFGLAPTDAPPCQFWASCYRRNPQHFQEFSHPDANGRPARISPQVQSSLYFNSSGSEDETDPHVDFSVDDSETSEDSDDSNDSNYTGDGMASTEEEEDSEDGHIEE